MNDNKIQRRSFLKLTGAALAGMSLPFKGGRAEAGISTNTVSAGKFWINPGTDNEYFRHAVVNTKSVNTDNIIWGKVDGLWQKYQITEFNDEFFEWWVNDTLDRFDRIFSGQQVPNGGKHTPAIATYSRRGTGRGDSSFHLNNALKSVALVPKVEYLDEYISVYAQYIKDRSGPYSLDWKKERLKDKNYWDRRFLASTDLYSGQRNRELPEVDVETVYGFKESHYLLNTMVNPVATLLYLDTWTQSAAPTWEIRGIAVNTHWNNPDDDETTLLYQKYRKAIMYPHMAQHGQTERHIGVVFHIIEQFDNRDSNAPPGRGVRIVPPGFPYLSHAEYLMKKMVGKV